MSDLPADRPYRLDPARRARLDAAVDRGARIAFWGLIQFGLHWAEQICELLAPLAFLAGLAWWAVLHVAAGVQVEDPQIQRLIQRVPDAARLAGHALTPDGLIWDGLLLMAVVAACRTLSGIIARET